MPRPRPDVSALARAVRLIRGASRPLLVAGGGVIYSGASAALGDFADATGVPVAETQAGKGSLPFDHPLALGAVGATGSRAANEFAREADVVIGVGTRWSDFTTASRTAFAHPGARFVNVNIAAFDAAKHAGLGVVGDARETLAELASALRAAGWSVAPEYRERADRARLDWDAAVEEAYTLGHGPLPAHFVSALWSTPSAMLPP